MIGSLLARPPTRVGIDGFVGARNDVLRAGRIQRSNRSRPLGRPVPVASADAVRRLLESNGVRSITFGLRRHLVTLKPNHRPAG